MLKVMCRDRDGNKEDWRRILQISNGRRLNRATLVLHLLEEEESLVCYELEDTMLDIQPMFLKESDEMVDNYNGKRDGSNREPIVHHSLFAIAVAYAMFTGKGQLYTFMVLISEITTPEINMRWYLDTAGLKRSSAYLINGVVIFFAWLVARILLFATCFVMCTCTMIE
ncbi:hypothetical protein LOK49_LG07G01787 [Camellia lanceoleosa]|uniref:Uncharacterized protein n=1 Tax=Camellia lanceoleosa TaxID=1840588 RepID=A0ACC0H6J2_9ERIC|nr:hypothetical protein LOK49_LG07G01787 [Camellia lanceoleosa]